MVASRREHPAAAVEDTLRRFRRSAGCTPPFPVLCGSSGHPVKCVLDARMVELQWHSIAECQIARSDEEKVETRHGSDFLDALDRFAIFDLKRQEYFPVRVRNMLACVRKSPIRVRSRAI